MLMPQPTIGLLKEDDQDERLEMILRRLGYQVFSYTRCHLMLSSLATHEASLALVNRNLSSKETELVCKYLQRGNAGAELLLCGDRGRDLNINCGRLDDPFDIPRLNEKLQSHLPRYGRKKLRAAIRLPALVCDHEDHLLGEVCVLGTGGAQLQSPTKPLHCGQSFEVVIPLLGQKKELEIPCEVLYAKDPCSNNNFHYQAGVRFLETASSLTSELETYLSHHLLTAPDENGYSFQQVFRQEPPPETAPSLPVTPALMRIH